MSRSREHIELAIRAREKKLAALDRERDVIQAELHAYRDALEHLELPEDQFTTADTGLGD